MTVIAEALQARHVLPSSLRGILCDATEVAFHPSCLNIDIPISKGHEAYFFSQYLLNTYHVPGIYQRSRQTTVPAFLGLLPFFKFR